MISSMLLCFIYFILSICYKIKVIYSFSNFSFITLHTLVVLSNNAFSQAMPKLNWLKPVAR